MQTCRLQAYYFPFFIHSLQCSQELHCFYSSYPVHVLAYFDLFFQTGNVLYSAFVVIKNIPSESSQYKKSFFCMQISLKIPVRAIKIGISKEQEDILLFTLDSAKFSGDMFSWVLGEKTVVQPKFPGITQATYSIKYYLVWKKMQNWAPSDSVVIIHLIYNSHMIAFGLHQSLYLPDFFFFFFELSLNFVQSNLFWSRSVLPVKRCLVMKRLY